MNLKDVIRDYPDYPKKGIIFKDMWPAIEDPDAFEQILSEFEKEFGGKIDTVIGIESRGFIFGAALANRLKISFCGRLTFGQNILDFLFLNQN